MANLFPPPSPSDANDEDNCASATMAAYYGYCNGVDPTPTTCTDEFRVKTYPGADDDQAAAKTRRRTGHARRVAE